MEESVYKTLADQTFELYQSFISSGFTEEQAFELVKSQYAFSNINYKIERSTKALEENIRKLRKYRHSEGG